MADSTPTALQQQQAASNRAAEDARKARVEGQKQAEAGVDERLAVKQRQVEEAQARQDASQPTPTQRENDLARVGALNIDDKEDDGSEVEADAAARVHNEKLHSPYSESKPQAHRDDEDTKQKRKVKGKGK